MASMHASTHEQRGAVSMKTHTSRKVRRFLTTEVLFTPFNWRIIPDARIERLAGALWSSGRIIGNPSLLQDERLNGGFGGESSSKIRVADHPSGILIRHLPISDGCEEASLAGSGNQKGQL